MKLISAERQKGAKKLHRMYSLTNYGDVDFPFDMEEISRNEDTLVMAFESAQEGLFLQIVEDYRQTQLEEQTKLARKVNIVPTHEDSATQGSKEWLESRIGLITASKTPFKLDGKPIPTFDDYINEKVAEAFIKLNGGEQEEKMPPTQNMVRGTNFEKYAIERYEELTGRKVEKRNLIVADTMKVGASPDGVTTDEDGNIINVEVKSVLLKNYLGELVKQKVSNQYFIQVQVQMFLLDADYTDFLVQQSQRAGKPFELIIRRIERDELVVSNMIETIKEYEEKFEERLEILEKQVIV